MPKEFNNIESSSPTPEKQEDAEWLMAPLRELVQCKIFDGGWHYVTVAWTEPGIREDGQISLAESDSKRFTATGKLNEQFITWASQHYQYWTPKALVPLDVVRIELPKEGQIKELAW